MVFCDETTSYTCNEEGGKVCKANYYPEGECMVFCDETTSYTCNEEGGKVCKADYHPENDCSTYCKPVEGNYTCDERTGEKMCAERKKGRNCDRCDSHYFDETCSKFCKSNED